jgi:hypothetical protein
MVGDPLQAQPVAAGGLAVGLAEQTRQGLVPAVELVVNRRQVDPVERQALTAFRQGEIQASQDLRDEAGWEHHHSDRDQALQAMAAAVLADIDIHGPERVAVLAVTHADREAIADRVRAGLVSQGVIFGPALEGPGWAGPRAYQAGDRIVLHAHADLPDGRRLTNGTVATITAVTPTGLTVRVGAGRAAVLPAGFLTGRGGEGRPRVSDAWARTIDGVQGGTWDRVHLLATPALDRYRGYVGQSRSIAPTHTWNTTTARVDDGDHGGRSSARSIRRRPSRSPLRWRVRSPRPSPRPMTPTASMTTCERSDKRTGRIFANGPQMSASASSGPASWSRLVGELWPTARTGCGIGRTNIAPAPDCAVSPVAGVKGITRRLNVSRTSPPLCPTCSNAWGPVSLTERP